MKPRWLARRTAGRKGQRKARRKADMSAPEWRVPIGRTADGRRTIPEEPADGGITRAAPGVRLERRKRARKKKK